MLIRLEQMREDLLTLPVLLQISLTRICCQVLVKAGAEEKYEEVRHSRKVQLIQPEGPIHTKRLASFKKKTSEVLGLIMLCGCADSAES